MGYFWKISEAKDYVLNSVIYFLFQIVITTYTLVLGTENTKDILFKLEKYWSNLN